VLGSADIYSLLPGALNVSAAGSLLLATRLRGSVSHRLPATGSLGRGLA